MSFPGELRVLADGDGVRDAALSAVLEAARAALDERGEFHLALAGGSTPKALYHALAERELDHSAWVLHFGDERCVPPDDAHSNYRMVREAWLDASAHPPREVHRMRGEDPPEVAAAEYERGLRERLGARPRLDLALLGMGPDGHTASLFPGTAALEERERLVCVGEGPPPARARLTLTLPALQLARELVFLVQGAEKRDALRQVLAPREGEAHLPARRVAEGAPRVVWLVDRAAAGELEGR